MNTEPEMLADQWGRLIAAVVHPKPDDRGANLALAMSLGSALAPDAVAASVTQATGDGYRTPVWSHQLALDLDHAQYESGAGPCVATAADGRPHTIRVMSDEPLYPAFTAVAVGRGVRCSLSLPLPGCSRASALNLYARTPWVYDSPRTRATAELLAHCVGALLTEDAEGLSRPNATGSIATGSIATGSIATGSIATSNEIDGDGLSADAGRALGRALEDRSLVERAQQELVDRGAGSSDQAYVQLTKLSRTEQRSIFAVAADLVQLPPDAPLDETRTT